MTIWDELIIADYESKWLDPIFRSAAVEDVDVFERVFCKGMHLGGGEYFHDLLLLLKISLYCAYTITGRAARAFTPKVTASARNIYMSVRASVPEMYFFMSASYES